MSGKPIEILGKTFNNEEEAKEHFKSDLRRHLPELKKIEGFPIGEDEDILALSDPPYYTACPNPYINEFIEQYGKPYDEETDDYHKEPFIGDISEGKNNPIYMAHSYHTKVPHTAIKKYINHYTSEGEIVFDGFSGTGMTGVAAVELKRYSIISDLSPIASFLSACFNQKNDVISFSNKAKDILAEVIKETSWMYQTNHNNCKALINYVVWSDVLLCPYCKNEFIFGDVAINLEKNVIKDEFYCNCCNSKLTKKECEKATETIYDESLSINTTVAKQTPILINYTYNKKTYEKVPDKFDLELLVKIKNANFPYWFPINKLPEGYNTSQPGKSHGVYNIHQFYTKRNLIALSSIYHKASSQKLLLFWLTSSLIRTTKMYKFTIDRKMGTVSGTLYIPSLWTENSALKLLLRKLKDISKINFPSKNHAIISTCSNTKLNFKSNSIDYIFTDPPFGDNIMYSELNFIWEGWLKLFTNNKNEAIINAIQHKDLQEYYSLMLNSFKECYRILKPHRWITVEFHNSKSSVWNSIQGALIKAGFIIAQVSVLDKKQGSFKQVTSSGAVKSDLVISAYKPSSKFEEQFLQNAGEGLEIDFVQEFLHQQPVKPLMERTEKMLYSKMLSYYIQHGYEVRYDAKAFYQLLRNNFAEEDGYWFNAGQINSYMEYKKKMKLEGIDEIKQGAMMLFVNDEKSALVWLHHFLNHPKSFSDIHTAFTQLANIQADEVPELRDLLEQNFISEDGLCRRPRTEPEHSLIVEKREKQLLKQFESLLIQAKTERKKIKIIRKEAVQLGFENCYKAKRFRDIVDLAERFDRSILEENAELKEFVDAAEISLHGLN